MNLKPTHVYANHCSTGWTRIEVLVALYDAALRHVDAFQVASQAGDAAAAGKSRLRGVRVISGLRAGLDMSQGDLPRRIDQLCEFTIHALLSGDRSSIASAARVLGRLREGFATIEQQAIALELRGEIAPLRQDARCEIVA